jgi:uncharacterized protein (TIGR03643 family)
MFVIQMATRSVRSADSSDSVATLSDDDVNRIVQMAWEDRTAFDTITAQFGVSEAEVIRLMRNVIKRSSFELWRRRVSARKTKHLALRQGAITRFKSPNQKGRQ